MSDAVLPFYAAVSFHLDPSFSLPVLAALARFSWTARQLRAAASGRPAWYFGRRSE